MEFTGERVVPGKVPADLYNEHLTRYLFAKELIQPNQIVLDAGCGTGYGTSVISAVSGVEVYGIDIADEAVDYAKAHYESHNCKFVPMDLLDISFSNKQFDAVVSFEVIEHLEHPEKFLQGIKSTMKPNGFLVLSTPNRKMYSDSTPDYKNPYHVREYYHDEFAELLQGAFSHVQLYAQDFAQGMVVQGLQDSGVEYEIAKYRPLAAISENRAEEASFFIAICSDVERSVEPRCMFPFTSNNILAEKDRYIAALRHEIEAREEATSFLQNELHTQASWIETLQHEVAKRDETSKYLQREVRAKTDWIHALQLEVTKRDETTVYLQRESSTKTSWIESLQREVGKRDETTTYLQSQLSTKEEQLNSLQQRVVKQDEAISRLQREQEDKLRWIESLQQEVAKRDEATLFLQRELQTNAEWIAALQQEVKKRDESVTELQDALKRTMMKEDEDVEGQEHCTS